jgi:hypothetical protein
MLYWRKELARCVDAHWSKAGVGLYLRVRGYAAEA